MSSAVPAATTRPATAGALLRETPHFVATANARGVRLRAKDAGVTPRSHVVRAATYATLGRMSDAEFDGSVVLELGVGCFARRR